MNALGLASELDAVNEMLAAIGEDPVEIIENLPPSGNTALTTLRAVSRDFQEEAHWFNTETGYELTPNASGEIIIPSNILSLDGTEADVIERRPRLYDRENATFIFTAAVACDVILQLPWSELPSVARRYITAMATERFVDGFPGATAVTEARNRNLMRAKVAFERAVIRNEDLNLVDNETIQQLTRRS